jgi:hypothetical protein
MNILYSILIAGDPFAEMRSGLATLLMAILGLVAMVAGVVLVIQILNGDREGSKKAATWAIITAAGFALIALLGNI